VKRRRHLAAGPALAALALGLLLTALGVAGVQALEDRRLESEAQRRAANRIAAVRQALEGAVEATAAVARVLAAMQPVSRAQFEAITQPLLDKNPQVAMITWQRLVDDAGRAAFEAARRAEFPGFAIRELRDGRMAPAPRRPQYRVVDYLVPLAGNELALGMDANSRSEQLAAAGRACAAGAATMTAQYDLLLGNTHRPGFALLMPVYRDGAPAGRDGPDCKRVQGYVVSVLSSATLFRNSLNARGLLVRSPLGVRVYAAAGPDPARLVFTDGGGTAAGSWLGGRAPALPAQTFQVGGQPWHVAVTRAAPDLVDDHLGSLLTLAGGLVASLGAAALAGVLAARARAIGQMVATRTAELTGANRSLRLRQQAIDACVNSIIITSAAGPDYPIEYVNPAFEDMNGYSAAEVTGRSCALLWRDDLRQRGVRDVLALVRARRAGHAVVHTFRKDGSQAWCEMYIAPCRDDNGEVGHFVVVQHDITEKRRYEGELEFQATHDALTGLPNRTRVRQRLHEEISVAARGGHAVWVLFVDLDRFKYVNDSLGHRAGNEFLCAIAARLRAAVRPADTVGRLGGDEFVLVLPERAGGALGAATVERIMAAVAQPVTIDGQQFTLGCSVGVANYPADGSDPDSLVDCADRAMFEAKQRGPNHVQYFMAEMNERFQERRRLERALRGALEAGQFGVAFQPRADLASGRIVAVEAQLCWRHPEFGQVEPERFLPLAEETGLSVPLGAWLLRHACAQVRAWQDAGLGEVRVAVSVGARQLREAGMVATVEAALGESSVPGRCLQLQLAEGVVMDEAAQAYDVLERLRALGVALAIDQFGTGRGNLAELKRFPIDALKIDRSLVRGLSPQPGAAAIPAAIVSMAHSLGIRVIAAGVDSEMQCELLARDMCDEVQGALLSAPLDAAALAPLLAAGTGLPPHLLRLHKRERTLLLVDDEPNILAALKRQMRGAGCRILTAPGGQEGLELLAREEVDVIVSDQRMPGMTGVEFLRAVKVSHPDTVRMVLSGFTELQSVTDAVNEGAIYKFLTKPWDDTQLRAHIDEAFRHKEMADENRRLGLELRTANLELAGANRQLEDLLQQQRDQIKRDNISLDIAREALQHVPLAILGLDEEAVAAYANPAAQALFRQHGPLLGTAAAEFMPAVLAQLRAAPDGQPCAVELNGTRYLVVAHSMGRGTRSRGRLVTFSPDVGPSGRAA
jgi:diguanylate cyclase (GGDEF)-like protein/PAS domain S-box-containing protein